LRTHTRGREMRNRWEHKQFRTAGSGDYQIRIPFGDQLSIREGALGSTGGTNWNLTFSKSLGVFN